MSAMNIDSCLIGSNKTEATNHQTLKIRSLNDALRKTGCGGKVLITDGVMALGTDFAGAALKAVQAFDSFSDANDPWGEHDFGTRAVLHQRVLWKIDYYDRKAELHSPDPSCSKVRLRVLTIMWEEEY